MAARVVINPALWKRVGQLSAGSAAHRAARVTKARVREEVIKAGRVETGALASSWEMTPRGPTGYVIWSPVPYMKHQEWGVGPFGPRRASHLVFVPKGGSKPVFAKHVSGFKGAHMMEKALRRLSLRDFL